MAVKAPMNFNGFVESRHCISFKGLLAAETPLLKGADLCDFLVQLDQREYEVLTQENLQLKTERDQIGKIVKKVNFIMSIIAYSCAGLGIIFYIIKFYYGSKKKEEVQKIENRHRLMAEFDKEHDFDKLRFKNRHNYLDTTREERERYNNLVQERFKKFSNNSDTREYAWDIVDEYKKKAEKWSERGLESLFVAGVLKLANFAFKLNFPEFMHKIDTEINRNRQLRILDKIRTLENRVRGINNPLEIEQLSRAIDYFKTFWSPARENASVVLHEHRHEHNTTVTHRHL